MTSWKELAQCAADVYHDDDRVHEHGMEYATYALNGTPVFAIAGTNGWKDWGCNLHRDMITVVLRGRNVKVHSGFQKAAAELYHCFVLWRADQPDKVMLTGHSMGAAVAAMMAMLSEEDDPERIEKLCCVAMPRLGNKTLRRVFDEQFTRDRYRMYGRKLDPICHLPWFGYARAGHITWLPSKFDMRLDHAAKKYVALIKD